jgi:hypothetical protein
MPCKFTPIILQILQGSCVDFVSALELEIRFMRRWPVVWKSDPLNVQLIFLWEFWDRGPPQRSAVDYGTRFDRAVDFVDLWAFLRPPLPAFRKKPPEYVIKHSRRPHRHHRKQCLAVRITTLPVRGYPRQNLRSQHGFGSLSRMIWVCRTSPRR